MARDTLFLLKGNFIDGGERYYCPECAQVEGVLSFYPELRSKLDVRYVDFARPRPEIVNMIGEANQSCPVLVVGSSDAAATQGIDAGDANGKKFVAGAEQIGLYLAKAYGVAKPH